MSKSLKRVMAALEAAGLGAYLLEVLDEIRTAADAARKANCHIDQIAKSIIFQRTSAGDVRLFITSGGNRVDSDVASVVTGEPLARADAGYVRQKAGFAVGGVAPIVHLNPPTVYFDPSLFDFEVLHAAAGTPRHIFPISPVNLERMSGGIQAKFATK